MTASRKTRKVSSVADVVDIRADDSEHAMEHFNEGLRRVLRVPKSSARPARKKKRR